MECAPLTEYKYSHLNKVKNRSRMGFRPRKICAIRLFFVLDINRMESAPNHDQTIYENKFFYFLYKTVLPQNRMLSIRATV